MDLIEPLPGDTSSSSNEAIRDQEMTLFMSAKKATGA